MLYKLKYKVNWVATSHDEERDPIKIVYVEPKGGERFDHVVERVRKQEEKDNQYSLVRFISIKQVKGVIWKD